MYRVHNEKFRKGSFIQAQWKTDVSSKTSNTPTLLFNLDPMNQTKHCNIDIWNNSINIFL